MKYLIVSRHAGAIEWLRRKGITGRVVSHVDDPAQVAGLVVIGALPLHLAVRAEAVVSIEMPRLAESQRGRDLSADEMDAAGASLSAFVVRYAGDEVFFGASFQALEEFKRLGIKA